MNPSTITLLFLLFAILMFVTEKLPLGLTSMIVCCGLVVTGVLDVKTAFAGFIDSNVILFVAMSSSAVHCLRQEWQVESEALSHGLPGANAR